jgi:eukaryotic-like serine/threonine-protein kinase
MDNGEPLKATLKFEGDLRSSVADAAPTTLPDTIGRYRIIKLLGKGGFGLVYLAHDDQLNRPVAVKVPHANRVARPENAELYLAEARTVASLEHPHIVPVYDLGSTAEFPFFVVSKYVEGTDLATRLKDPRLSWQQAAELAATVAEALHYAHKRGLVHRDVKPGNILIDSDGMPHVVDFGLALREENVGKGPRYVGTPTYMSPEQARGEGHRVDGRSDIFSLGVVFYELLVGRQPFRGDTQVELLEQITTQEPRPPRQYDDSIPKELERICFKALAKRASERYMTAKDLADDLKHFLAEQTLNQQSGNVGTGSGSPAVMPVMQPPSTSHASSRSGATSATATTPSSDGQPIKIVPKGLRSFDAHDADFFLELLPGPRDREGLPDNIRFWKTRIEATDPDSTFSVGLIYGPSGCGKSSLVKAGLLPCLSEDVIAVYVEATAEETETRVLNGLRMRCASLSDNLSLKETMAALRRGQGIPAGKKVLIILDQFEQWLHAKKEEQNAELVQALRQCEGGRVQCIVMVRDDFWLAVSRFMRELEVRLVEGQNSALVDLFNVDHAKRVLAAFGRAFGKLLQKPGATTREQKQFLEQAVNGLAQDGKVVCVRLALFAEMMKGKQWTPAALKEVGGTEGIGVTFLEETFSATTAPPEHRYYQKAARSVLKALLPESGTEIKGHMRSRQELMEASGCGDRSKDFDDLIHILDSEIRLITPTDPEGSAAAEDSLAKVEVGQKYYQLTHDYLVHSLQDWLTRKQKEARRGRAELRLADRAALWNAKPENRHLPSLWEFLNVWLLTDRKKWTEPQRKMMGKAGRAHGIRSGIAAAAMIAILFGAWEIKGRFQAASLVKRLASADIAEVPGIVQEMDGYRRWAEPLLRQEDAKAAQGSNQKLHLALALLPREGKIAELRDNLPLVSQSQFPVVRDALLSYKESVVKPLWETALDPSRESQQRFQAACALATYTPEDLRWNRINSFVAGRLVTLEASALVAWREAVRPARGQLIKPLAVIYRDTKQNEQSRSFATETLGDYAADQPDELFDLLADAEQFQFPVMFAKLTACREKAVALADQELGKQPPAKANEEQKELLAKRQANAAVALYRLGMPERVWPLLKFSPDPRVRSYVINWLGPLGGDRQPVIQRLDTEPDLTIRRALVLTLGQFTETQLSRAERQPLIEKLLVVYENEPDAGLHGAAEWLLRKWGQRKRLDAVLDKLKSDEKQLQGRKATDKRQWYINSQKQTFVIVDAGEFLMGSPESERDRLSFYEVQHRVRIGRRFAISAHEVTKGEFGEFQSKHPEIYRPNISTWAKTHDSPQVVVSWFDAAAYCNWLSEQDHIEQKQWCYEPNKEGKYAAGMKAKEKFWELTGYRLPTEAEWEFACRAGTVTSRYYGLAPGLLPQYAWFLTNGDDHAWPTASVKPNDFGLFDMLGNAYEWCFDELHGYPAQKDKVFEDMPPTQPVQATGVRLLRGGAFDIQPSHARSADRVEAQPGARGNHIGFRAARTYR